MLVNSNKIMKLINRIAPEFLIEDWDNSGFLLGNQNKVVEKIMLTLDVDDKVIQEAIDQNVDLIVTHHPILFNKASRITSNDSQGAMLIKLIKSDINVIAAHSNLDSAPGGLADSLARKVGIIENSISNLHPVIEKQYSKLIFYIPEEIKDDVLEVIERNNAGFYKGYAACTFSSFGTGTFRPLSGSNPNIGTQGKLENVEEVRIETIVEKHSVDDLVEEIKRVHPYELPAYDVFRMENSIEQFSSGKIGMIESVSTLDEYVLKLKEEFKLGSVKYVEGKGKVLRVAVCPGSGIDFIEQAFKNGADTFISGDVKHHDALDYSMKGMNIIDLGHFESEYFYLKELKRTLESMLEEKSYDVKVIIAAENKSPFKYL